MFWSFLFMNKKYIISCSTVYSVYLCGMFMFVSPESLHHFLYVFLYVNAVFLGVYAARRYRGLLLRTNFFFLILITSFIALFFYFAFKELGNFNIGAALSASLHESRTDVSLSYFEYMFTRTLVIFPALFMFVMFNNIFIKLAIAVIAIIISLASYQKSPAFLLILSILAFYSFGFLQNRNPNVFLLLFYVCLGALLIIVMGSLISWFFYRSDFFVTFMAVLRRILFLPGDLSYNALQVLDKYQPFFGGTSFVSVFRALDLPWIQLSKENYISYYGTNLGGANTPALTSLYGDFRLFGIVIGFCIGYVLRIFDNTILHIMKMVGDRSRKNITVFYVVTIVITLKLNITAFGTALLSEGLLFSILLTYLVACSTIQRVTFSK